MSENDGKKGTSTEPREEVSGTAGLERTVGTTPTSTGTVERTGVALPIPDTGAGGLNTISSNQQTNEQN
jgi:hypothetical protein